MTQTRPVTQAFPQVAILLAVAFAAVVTLSALLVNGSLALPDINLPGERGVATPAQQFAEREWERQRHQISGYVDPRIRAEQEWERVRKQISGAYQ
ncbi:MAG TPA: hypothetical protein VFP30_06030 [Candidatus Limnocylindria bacterium]|nr:hypothetical protein [Candidatus Limnocylindria bacterium]